MEVQKISTELDTYPLRGTGVKWGCVYRCLILPSSNLGYSHCFNRCQPEVVGLTTLICISEEITCLKAQNFGLGRSFTFLFLFLFFP
ncbi:unnamed protein product, partial [Vitis vinifera]